MCMCIRKTKTKATNNIHTRRGDIALQSPSKKKIKNKQTKMIDYFWKTKTQLETSQKRTVTETKFSTSILRVPSERTHGEYLERTNKEKNK